MTSKQPISWLTLRQAAERIGISPRQLAQRAEHGEIAHKREGRRGRGGVGQYLFEAADVEAYNSRKRIPARFEWAAKIDPHPKRSTWVFIDPDSCGNSLA
jgi:hypothetical protein